MTEVQKEIPVVIKGLSCFVPSNTIEPLLLCKREERRKEFDPRTRKMMFREKYFVNVPLYNRINDKGLIHIGIGAIKFIKENEQGIKIKCLDYAPKDRKTFNEEIQIPEKIINSRTYTVKGKERYYFLEALESCKKNNIGLLSMPTGCGKSEIEITLAYNQERIFGRQLFVVPTVSIKDQMIERAKNYGINLVDYREVTSLIDNEEDFDNLPKIIISTPLVILNDFENEKYKRLHESVSCIITDESHRTGCDTWSKLFLSLPNVYRIHGFSAMPISRKSATKRSFSDMEERDAINISVSGDVIYHKTPQELKEFLNIPVLINFHYSWKNYSPSILNMVDWHTLYKRMMENKDRNEIISKILEFFINKEYNSISYVARKQHGVNLLAGINSSQATCWYAEEFYFKESNEITKLTTKEYTQQDLRKEFGKTKRTIIASKHLTEGVDFSAPLQAIIMTEGRSERESLQKVGRIVRPSDKQSIIVNFVDVNQKVLNSQSRDRRELVIQEFGCEKVFDVYNLEELEKIFNLILKDK